MAVVLRILVVLLSAAMAALASLFMIMTLGMERITQWVHSQGQEGAIEAWFVLVRQSIDLVPGLTVLPAVALVIIGEVGRIRSSVYYIGGGGLALAVIPFLSRLGQSGTFEGVPAALWQVLATAGFVGGFVYWLLAGRRA